MKKFLGSLKQNIAAAAMLIVGAVGMQTKVSAQDDKTILGAGSSFINPLFSKIFADYNQRTGIQVNYQSIGSGGGILQLTNKTVDFGASDGPLNDEQTAKMGVPALHIPQASGAVVITYNLPGDNNNISLTPDIIANIFLGNIKMWNDAKITSINKGVSIPALPILVVHRSDGSGTTNIFTNYLSKVSPDWKSKVGSGGSVNWPAGLGGKGSEGVAGLVKQTPGGIGYVELIYALQNKLDYAKIQNKKGKFIMPSIASVTAAGNVKLPDDSKIFITDTDAADGYPIAGFTWVLIYKEQNYNGRSAAKAKELLKLLWWNIHDGQKFCEPLNYSPLSKEAIKVAEKILKSATYDGKEIL
ncbi:MAG TPA: phosphate ABC transporter substrate-binding protein PstS [Puia sp.]